MNFTPPLILPLPANFGATSEMIIPVSIDITGAPISSIENPPKFNEPRNVANPAISAHISMPGPFFLINVIIFLLFVFAT